MLFWAGPLIPLSAFAEDHGLWPCMNARRITLRSLVRPSSAVACPSSVAAYCGGRATEGGKEGMLRRIPPENMEVPRAFPVGLHVLGRLNSFCVSLMPCFFSGTWWYEVPVCMSSLHKSEACAIFYLRRRSTPRNRL